MAQSTDSDNMNLPMSFEELRRHTRQGPSAEVPTHLSQLTSSAPPQRRSVQFVDRADIGKQIAADTVSTMAGSRPAWVGSSVTPARARMPHPPSVSHRRERLTPLTIWGADDRAMYNDTSYPWGCICKITTAFGRGGSGVLIGPRHVLTASHVVEWSTSQPERIDVHLTGTVSAATAFDTLAYAFTKISGDPTVTTLDEDYAVLVLDQRLGDRFGFLGAKVYDSAWDDQDVWFTIGYPGDVANGLQPTFQRTKNLDEDEWDYGSGRAMTTSADAMSGQSGSPMFGFWANDPIPYAVAVMSATGNVWLSGLENWCSGGSDLNRLIKLARDENP
jgi:V8-like Glu-specific endopeptidase